MGHFDVAVAEVLRAEGGLLVDPGEGGGAANMGITMETYRIYHNNPKLTIEDLKKLTVSEAKAIYKKIYWDALGLDAIKGKLSAIIVMDQAVNRGREGVRQLLISSINYRMKKNLKSETAMTALFPLINSVADREFFRRVIADVQGEYVMLCQKKPEKLKWLRGWLIRTHNLLKLLV